MTKILLVEDDKSLREIYGVRLLAEGYDIVSAGDGEEALAMAIKERPQLIVSDVMMPKISGFDMLDILRSTTETKDIKVIMMTALSSEDQRARGEALGADRYLVKSQVGIEDVVRTVHEVLGDAIVTSSPETNPFMTPESPRPAMPTAPGTRQEAPVAYARPTQPAAAPAPQQFAPQQPPQAQSAPAPQPVASFTPPAPQVAPQPAQAPAASGLPVPTAPFSTNRPANLGDRIIHPLTQTPSPQSDMANLMEQELHGAVALPPVPPAPQVQMPPQVQPDPQPIAPQAPSTVAPAPTPMDFEETPPQGPQQPPAF